MSFFRALGVEFTIAFFCIAVLGWIAIAGQEKIGPAQANRIELQRLKDQLFASQVDAARCHASLADVTARLDSGTLTQRGEQLKAEREALEKELIKSLGGGEGDSIDWTTDPPSLKRTGP